MKGREEIRTPVENNSLGIEEWLRVIRADGVGPVLFKRLLKRFNSVEKILGTSVTELTRIEGIGTQTAERIRRSIDAFDVEKELEQARKLGVWMMHICDSRYPKALRKIYDPPPVLYVKGNLVPEDALSVAIVGSRRCSTYGSEQAQRFGYTLAVTGFTVVSGMARGIDSAAHHGALNGQGRTIAVQGCGLGHIFPQENTKLFEQISENGACVSELPLDFEPKAENFPGRNRIIAGLTLGTIVIEAAMNSGALITARHSMENNREVMAVPGKIDSPLSSGAHKLIKQGAALIEGIEDVMESLGYIGRDLQPHAQSSELQAIQEVETPLFDAARLNLNEKEKAVFNRLNHEAIHIEEIIEKENLDPGTVNSALISLRLKGMVRQLPGNMFLRR